MFCYFILIILINLKSALDSLIVCKSRSLSSLSYDYRFDESVEAYYVFMTEVSQFISCKVT